MQCPPTWLDRGPLGRVQGPRCHKTVIACRHGTAIIASGIAATLGGDMAETSVDFGILAGAGAPVREFKAGETIFKQGEAASEFFVIQSGRSTSASATVRSARYPTAIFSARWR